MEGWEGGGGVGGWWRGGRVVEGWEGGGGVGGWWRGGRVVEGWEGGGNVGRWWRGGRVVEKWEGGGERGGRVERCGRVGERSRSKKWQNTKSARRVEAPSLEVIEFLKVFLNLHKK